MAQAKRKPTTKPSRKPAPPSRQFTDPATLPDLYCSTCEGDCLQPLIPNGATIAFSKLEVPKAGDFVVVWKRPEIVEAGRHQAIVKRMVMNIPPWVKSFPFKEHPQSEVHALIVAEQMNPRRAFSIKCSDVIAVHKAIGYLAEGRPQASMINTDDLLPMPV